MTKATLPSGDLIPIEDCFIRVPVPTGSTAANSQIIELKALPDISDSKSASYNDEPIIGRATPIKTYSHSDNRVISMTLHFFIVKEEDIQGNLETLRLLESIVYPRDPQNRSTPFSPPPVCGLRCGDLLAKNIEVTAILKNYSVRFPTEVPWATSEGGVGSGGNPGMQPYTPWQFDVSTNWEVVYTSERLPGQDRIIDTGFI